MYKFFYRSSATWGWFGSVSRGTTRRMRVDHGPTDGGTRPSVRFAILGSFECWADGASIALRGRLQERLAVSLLLNRNQVVPVSRLVETIWEDGGPDTAAHQVRKMTSDLRKRVPGMADMLTTSGIGYRIRVPE